MGCFDCLLLYTSRIEELWGAGVTMTSSYKWVKHRLLPRESLRGSRVDYEILWISNGMP